MDTAWLTRTPFAHRGLHDGNRAVAENSLPAFRDALAAGYGMELDVRLSGDGEVMVFHDDTLDRMTAQSGPVAQRSAAELGAIALNANGGFIPTLAQVLDLLAGRAPLLVEVKAPGKSVEALCAATARTIAGYDGDLAVMSFNPRIAEWFRGHAPQVVRGCVTTDYSTPDDDVAGWSAAELAAAIGGEVGDPCFYAHDIRHMPDTTTALARRRRVPLLTWTVRTDEQYRHARQHADNVIFEFLRP